MDKQYELEAIRRTYSEIKKLCYECTSDCDHCRVGDIREQIVELEKYYLDLNNINKQKDK